MKRILFVIATMWVVGATKDVDWPGVARQTSRLQSAVEKKDERLARQSAIEVIRLLPGEGTSYYAAVTVGDQPAIEVGAADEIIGSRYAARLNQARRGIGEYLAFDRKVTGLTVLLSDAKKVDGLLNWSYEYRFQPSRYYPIYAPESSMVVPQNISGEDTTDFISRYSQDYRHLKGSAAVLVPSGSCNIHRLSEREVVNVVFADLMEETRLGVVIEVLAVKAHYEVKKSEWTLVEGSLAACHGCAEANRRLIIEMGLNSSELCGNNCPHFLDLWG